MPFVFLIIGLMLVVIGIRGQQDAAIKLIQSEFTGPGSFIQWLIAIGILGLAGYIKPIKPVVDGLIFLIILVMILVNNKQTGTSGLFGKFEDALQNATPTPSPNNNTSQVNNGVGMGSSSLTSSGALLGFGNTPTNSPPIVNVTGGSVMTQAATNTLMNLTPQQSALYGQGLLNISPTGVIY